MASDFNKPATTDAYTAYTAELVANMQDLAKGLDPANCTVSNPPTGAIRWTSAGNKWEKWNGSAWAALTTTYAIDISGNAATATTALSVSWSNVAAKPTTLSGYGITDAMPLSGGTLSGALTISNAAPIIYFAETDQTLPAGRRRLVLDGNVWSMRRNTAAAGDYSTESTDISVDASGNFVCVANVTAYSDERVKTNWRSLGANIIEKAAGIKSGVYDRTDGDKVTQVGVSAQSLREVIPEAVLEDADGNLSVAYGNAALALCVELAKEVAALKAKIAEMEA